MKTSIFFRIFLALIVANSFVQVQSKAEPNNDMLTAEFTSTSKSYTDSVGTSTTDPADYYSFSSPTSCVLKIEIINKNLVTVTNGALDYVYITESGTTISTILNSSIASGLTAVTYIMCEANKIYYIPIKYSTGTKKVPYTLNLTINTTFIANDSIEFNNTRNTAYPLTKSYITGTVGLFGDTEDWYALKFSAVGNFTITVSNPATNPDIQTGLGDVRIYNASNDEQTSISLTAIQNTETSTTAAISVIAANQVFYIKIPAADNYSAADYTLKITSTVQAIKTTWAPTVPISKTFPDGSSNLIPGSNLITFSSKHPTSTAFRYDLYLDKTKNPTTKVLTNSALGEYTIPSVVWGDTLYWKAVAYTTTQDTSFTAVNQIKAQQFSEFISSIDGTSNGSVEWGDYDNDNDLDLLVMSYWYGSKIYRNDNNTFTNINANLISPSYGGGSWVDYDNDGDLDVFIAGNTQAKLYNNHKGIFTDINATIDGSNVGYNNNCRRQHWGDYDNDGDLDFLLSNTYSFSTFIYQNKGYGQFVKIDAKLKSFEGGDAEWGDFDNDGDLDILLAGSDYSIVYRNNGTNTFEDIKANLTNLNSCSCTWSDYDNDGDLDITLMGNAGVVKTTKIYKNNSGSFSEITSQLTQVYEGKLAWGDYDNDGDLDLLVTGEQQQNGGNPITKLYANMGNDTFTEQTTNFFNTSYSWQAWGDYDNDGSLDVIISGNNSSKIYNLAAPKNTVPTAPTNLTAVATENSIKFSWNRGTDAKTAKKGLNYTIFVKHNDSTKYLTPIKANLQTGYLRTPGRGQINDTTLTLNNLSRGSYTWGVQAIDAAFAGSPYATGTFTKANNAPIAASNIYPLNNGVVEKDTVQLKWTASDADGDVLYYTIKIGPVGNMKTVATDITAKTFIEDSLISGTIYNWQVITRDNFGGSTTSPIFAFITIGSEVESNNTMASANCSSTTAAFKGNVGNGNDPADYYCFSYPKNCFLTVTVNNTMNAAITNGGIKQVDITDGTTTITSIAPIVAGGTGNTKLMVNANKSYYIPITPNNAAIDNPYKISLVVEEFTPADNYENNNTKDNAYPLFHSSVIATVGYWSDKEDWYAFKTNASGEFKVKITKPTTIPNFNYGANCVVVKDGVNPDPANDCNINDTSASGLISLAANQTYYLVVYPYDANSAGDYKIEIISTIQETHATWAPTVPISEKYPNWATHLVAGENLLTFSSTHPTGDAIKYDLYLDNNNPPTTKVLTSSSVGEFNLSDVKWNDVYYWKAIAYTAAGDSTYSPVYTMSAQQFTDINAGLNAVNNSSVDWGDYDNDGDLDILLTGSTFGTPSGGTTKIYQNNAGIFVDINATLTAVSSGFGAWGDYDNDGDLDCIITGINTSSVGTSVIYKNNNGQFTNSGINNLKGLTSSKAAWGDYDNDGDLDLLLTGNDATVTNYVSKIYRNDNNTFTEINSSLTGGDNGEWGDYDNDGDLDILITGNTNSIIYKNNGSGTFIDIIANIPSIFSDGSAVWGDCDNDGDLDILITGNKSGGGQISEIYLNNKGVFTEFTTIYMEPVSSSSAAWGDYDNDGDLDIILCGYSNTWGAIVNKYHNEIKEGNGFTYDGGLPLGIQGGSVVFGDYDKDSDLDILISGMDNNGYVQTKIFKNNITVKNTKPSFNGAISAAVGTKGLTLKWDKATDVETPVKGLSYNISLKGPSSFERSPMADTLSGFRRIAQRGAIQDTTYTIDTMGMPYGIYKCMVQAVDAAFEGGNWSSQMSFSLSNNPSPTLTIVSPTNNATDIDTVGTQLKWSGSDPANEALTYNVYFGETNPPALKSTAQTATSYVLPQLKGKTLYYWNIEVKDTYGNITASGVQKFTTFKNDAPVVNLKSPGNGFSSGVNATLQWKIVDEEKNATSATLLFGRTNPPTYSVTIPVADTLRAIDSTLSYNTIYYWQIKAKDSYGATGASEIWSFNTSPDKVPDLTLLSPANGVVNVHMDPLELKWTGTDDGGDNNITYDLFFDQNNPPASKRLSKSSATSFSLDTICSTLDFYWQVIAYDKTGNDTVSPVSKFTSIYTLNNYFQLVVTDNSNKGIANADYTIVADTATITGKTDADGKAPELFTKTNSVDVKVLKTGRFSYAKKDYPLEPNTTTTLKAVVPPLADFNGDKNIDIEDLTELTSYWRNKDNTLELAPTTGTVPNYTVKPDGNFDFDDMMIFVMMWDDANISRKSNTLNAEILSANQTENSFRITSTEQINRDGNTVTYTFKLVGSGNLLGNSLKIKYDNNTLTYLGKEVILSKQYEELSILNRFDDAGYLEICTGVLVDNYIEGTIPLAEVTFSLNQSQHAMPVATYETYSKDKQVSKGAVKFMNQMQAISVYPNPVVDALNVEVGKISSPAVLTISDISGKVILHRNITLESEEIDLSRLDKGILLIQIEINNEKYNAKVVKL